MPNDKVEKIKITKTELDDIYDIVEEDEKEDEKTETVDGKDMSYEQTITYYEKKHEDDVI